MKLDELLGELARRGIRLGVEGDRLRVSAPEGTLTGALRDTIASRKSELIELLAAGEERAASPIPKRPPGVRLPASISQRRLWFMDHLFPGTAMLNLPAGLYLRGELDRPALEATLRELVRRHETLRTAIAEEDFAPVQIVADAVAVELPYHDLGELPETERECELARLADQEARHVFDLTKPPLFRVRLVRLDASEHALILVANHLIWDGWSFDVFLRELRITYAALSAKKPSPIADPPVQYGDFTLWHHDFVEDPEFTRQLAYWKSALEGGVATLDLPFDRPRPAVMSYRGGLVPLGLGAPLLERLRELARKESATLFMVLVAALDAVLHRYSGQTDISVGAPVEARARPEVENLVGLFVNTLVLRTQVDPALDFRELLSRVRETCLGAYAHQHVPFERLVEVLAPERDRGRTPLFQVLFSYQEASKRQSDMGGLTLSQFNLHSGATGTDLTVWIRDHGSDVIAALEFASDLFDTQTIERLAESYVLCLEAVARDPATKIAALPMLSQSLRRRVLGEWNETRREYAQSAMIHELFEARANEQPRKPALHFENERLDYRELDERSNQLAHELVLCGARPETVVGLCMERSTRLVVSMLAILKAGAAYLPLDPAYPVDRIRYMLEDSGAEIVLCDERSRALIDGRAECLSLDDPDTAAKIRARARHSPDRPGRSSQLAYVIYTSGSTGRPKGVLVEHRNVVSFFSGMSERGLLGPPGVWLSGTSISFDISVLEILGSLSHGFELVLLGSARLGATTDPRFDLAHSIERHAVTHFQCTPSQAAMLLADPASRAALARLELLLVGGEALPVQIAGELTRLGAEVVNVYGPTETTIWSTTHRLKDTPGRVLIGRPIANTRVYVLDANREPVPIGVPGELYIGGDGVVRGYHAQAELTRERFVEDRFDAEPGARLYRTGDIVRFGSDGSLEYLARNDQQVKIRGHRIELGEIEACLHASSRVADAVVVAREDEPGQTRLVAYIVSKVDGAFDAQHLKEELRQRLPEYMLPSAFVVLDALPQTANGKIDRKALPSPRSVSTPQRSARQAPQTELERAVAVIWTDVLGLREVGRDDDFFDLGGHSLIAVRLFSDVYKRFGVRLPLGALFEAPTVAALSQRILREGGVTGSSTELASASQWTSIVPIQAGGTKPPFFCAAGVGGNPMNLRWLAEQLGPDQPFFGLQHRGVDGRLEPHSSVEDMAREYLDHIRARAPSGPYYIGGFSGGGVAAYELAQQLLAAGQRVALLVLFDTINPLMPSRTLEARVSEHLERVRQDGASYLVGRVRGRMNHELERARLFGKAALSRLQPFEYRNEAVSVAWIGAQSRYRPRPYPGDVTLFQARVRNTGHNGLGLRVDESNGWRPFVEGLLEVISVDADHVSLVHEQHAKGTAAELRAALARASERSEQPARRHMAHGQQIRARAAAEH